MQHRQLLAFQAQLPQEKARKCCWNAKLAYIQLYHQACVLFAAKGGFLAGREGLYGFELLKEQHDILTMPGGIRDNSDEVFDSA